MAAAVRDRLDYIPAWGEFRLRQPNADGFTIRKRTASGHGWVPVDACRTRGGAGLCGVRGAVASPCHVRFLAALPGRAGRGRGDRRGGALQIVVSRARRPAMDLRFYHDEMGMTDFARQNEGLDITYEDYEPGWGDARGIARTTEFRLWALDTTPTRERLIADGGAGRGAARLLATGEAVHAAGVFGAWTLAGPSGGDAAGRIEARASRELDFYIGQVEQRRWYGFWNYGDVMHSYDADRHVWRYDIGGFAG
jgi:hypothetical protein